MFELIKDFYYDYVSDYIGAWVLVLIMLSIIAFCVYLFWVHEQKCDEIFERLMHQDEISIKDQIKFGYECREVNWD